MIHKALTYPLLRAVLIGAFYYLGAWIGITQTITPDGIAILWPPNAVLLAALLMTHPKEWPLISAVVLLAASLANISAFPLWSVVPFGLVNVFEGVLAAFLIRRFAGPEFRFQSLNHVMIFILAAPLLACSVAAILGAGIYEALDRTQNPFFVFWRLWWFADAVALLVLTPLFVSSWHALKTGEPTINWPKLIELLTIWLGVAITGAIAFESIRRGDIEFLLTPVMLIALALWTAIRFRLLATAATVTLIAAMTTALLVRAPHLYSAISPQYAVWLTQEYLAFLSIISITLCGLMQKIRHQHDSLLLRERALVASNDAITIADVRDPEMPIIWVNPKFEKLFRYSAEEVKGKNILFLLNDAAQQHARESLKKALDSHLSCRLQIKNLPKEGQPLWIELSLAPVEDPSGEVTHYIGIQRDITQEKAAELRLREATAALKRQNEFLEEKVQERTHSLEEANSALRAANQKLQELAATDFLTGIANRRQFYDLSRRELKRLAKDGRTAVLIAFDLDHFKVINDTFGHEAGDEVLQRIIMPVENNIRPADLFGRIGGEEFLILLPDEDKSTAAAIAERIRVQISGISLPHGEGSIHITASFGIAEWDGSCDLEQLIRQADLALYQAKKEGRNRVCVSTSSS